MKLTKDFFAKCGAVLVALIALIPSFSYGAVITSLSILQKCGAPGYVSSNGQKGCNWPELLILAQQVLGFAFFLGSMLAVISISYAGWLFISAAGNDGQISKAKGVFYNVVIGIIVMFMAWLVVNFILKGLGVKEGYTLLIGK